MKFPRNKNGFVSQSKRQKDHVDVACDQDYKILKSGGKLGFKFISLNEDGALV